LIKANYSQLMYSTSYSTCFTKMA